MNRMSKRVLKVSLIFFFLLALIGAEVGYYKAAVSSTDFVSVLSPEGDEDPAYPDNFPSDAEEDSTETRETDEYESHFISYDGLGIDRLLNLHYTYQHLLFKEHHIELVVPPPKA